MKKINYELHCVCSFRDINFFLANCNRDQNNADYAGKKGVSFPQPFPITSYRITSFQKSLLLRRSSTLMILVIQQTSTLIIIKKSVN